MSPLPRNPSLKSSEPTYEVPHAAAARAESPLRSPKPATDGSNFTPIWGDEAVFPLLHGLKQRGAYEVVLASQERIYKIRLGETPRALAIGLNSRFDALCLLKCTPSSVTLLTQKSNSAIADWPIYYIRNIQTAPERLRLEVWDAGGRSSSPFELVTSESETIFKFLCRTMKDFISKKDSEIVQLMQRDELQRSGRMVSDAQMHAEFEKMLKENTKGGFVDDGERSTSKGSGKISGMFRSLRKSVKRAFSSDSGEVQMQTSSFVLDPTVLPVEEALGSVRLGSGERDA